MRRTATAAILAVALLMLDADTARAVQQDLAQVRWDDDIERAENGAPVGPHRVYTQGIWTGNADDRFEAGPVKEYFLGDEYRDLWSVPIEVPIIDLSRTAGGLTPTGAAGGLQTSILFLEGADGRHFILRKMEKRAGDALPEGTRRTIVESLVEDQISSLNPYSAFVIAPLAEAAGVLHTSPQLVFIPDDPRLGEHRDAFANALGMLERKVDEDVSDEARFAYSREAIDFEDLYERIIADAETRVDQEAYARARLFDMFIGDRDRHDEQWFWAAVDDGRRFLPVPIDRDFAFARFDGLFNQVGRFTGKTVLRKQTYFRDEIDNLIGLNYQGAKLDLLFASELDRTDWIRIADELREALTDDVIDSALRSWPAPVYARMGEETAAALKSRRDDLSRAAEEYYELLMQKVDVVGSDESERFVIDRVDDYRTIISIEHDGQKLYRREFLIEETDEVRLYGLGGDDEFILTGPVNRGVNVFAVGGDGDDVVVADRGHQPRDFRFYDDEVNTVSRETAPDVKVLEDSVGYTYTLHRYEFDRVGPAVAFDYDSDEGIYLGGGIRMVRYGFMREPYAARHQIVANYAPRSRGYNIHYDGLITDFIGRWDLGMEADVLDFDRYDDFYGFGNETPSGANDQFVAHLRWIRGNPALERDLSSLVRISIGPYFEFTNVEPPDGVSESNPTQSGYTQNDFADKYFGGLVTRFEIDGRDTTAAMQSGLRFITEASINASLRRSDYRFARFASEASYALRLLSPVTVAFRAGGATNIGDFAFYQANTVGGRENLRGLSRTRYSGRTNAYANSELRLKLMDFNVYLTRGELGTYGFYDIGRVWADGDDSNRWHQGYGGGVWVTPFYLLTVRAGVGFSKDDRVMILSTGMFF